LHTQRHIKEIKTEEIKTEETVCTNITCPSGGMCVPDNGDSSYTCRYFSDAYRKCIL
jgi:hypothetical protein